jgi:hypothetical protein
MELGPYQLQIFISLVVILLAALVALICDFLKGNNEQLRELTIELKVRRDEERRYFQMLATQPAALEAEPAAAAIEEPAVEESIETPAPLAHPEPVAQVVEPPPPGPVLRRNWTAILARGTGVPQSADNVPTPATVIDMTDGIPSGFHEVHILRRLLNTNERISGLAVSIGVSAHGTMPDGVRDLVRSLIGPNDFACQSGDEEFLLLYPGERGASAHRRLSEIAQQLWNFQLGAMGTLSVVFSWGGVEVSGETVEEALASATERMQGTRRGRKLLMMKPAGTNLRQAV